MALQALLDAADRADRNLAHAAGLATRMAAAFEDRGRTLIKLLVKQRLD